jgi:hypothetical protein
MSPKAHKDSISIGQLGQKYKRSYARTVSVEEMDATVKKHQQRRAQTKKK